MSLEERVGQVEREQVRQGEQLGRLSAELGAVDKRVGDVGADVKLLLGRDAARPPALTFQVVAITCASLGSIAAVVWWLIGSAPAVVEMGRRLDRLDDPVVGRVPALEKRVEEFSARGWQVQVMKGR